MREEASKTALETLVEKRNDIIENILNYGLRPAADLIALQRYFVNSIDKTPNTKIYGHLLQSDAYIAEILYGDPNSQKDTPIFEVLMERVGQLPPFPDVLSAELEGRMNASLLVVCDSGNNISHRRETVLPEEMIGIIFPEQVWNEFYPLTSTPPLPITTVNTVTRRVEGFTELFNVPNYESALSKFLKDYKRIWVHGVRLPILGDM